VTKKSFHIHSPQILTAATSRPGANVYDVDITGYKKKKKKKFLFFNVNISLFYIQSQKKYYSCEGS